MPRNPLPQSTQKLVDYLVEAIQHPEFPNYLNYRYAEIEDFCSRFIYSCLNDPRSQFYSSISQNNKDKNRYSNIFPYDYNAVPTIDTTNCYINASAIDLPLRNNFGRDRAFIAAQGPLPNTVFDFWRLVYQREVRLIVCLASPTEGKSVKFHPYWTEKLKIPVGNATLEVTLVETEKWNPEKLSKSSLFHGYIRHLEGQRYKEHPCTYKVFTMLNNVTLRKFNLKFKSLSCVNESNVFLLSCSSWPDHKIMPVDEFLALLELSRFINCSIRNPVLVHCSAGVGRTGTFIAIDFITRYLEDSLNFRDFSLDPDIVYSTVLDLRKQRVNMVGSLEQFKFIYECVVHYFSGLGILRT